MSDQETTGLGGLLNMGLTCYANATVQALRHCSKIPWIFKEGNYNTLFDRSDATSEKRQNQEAFTKAFAEILQMLQVCKKGQQVRPGEFWTRLTPIVKDTCFEHFATRAPHDSHEFFLFLLDTIHESTSQKVDMKILKPAPTTETEKHCHQALEVWVREFSKIYSPFVSMFYGLFHVQVVCKGCANVSHRWETFSTLKAMVPPGGLSSTPPTLQAMLEAELMPETIEGYACDACSKRTTAERIVKLWRVPQTLVIVLKRFLPDGRKVNTRVEAIPPGPISLDSFFSDETPEKTGSTQYALRSIVDHHGSARGGHYTAQALHPGTSQWFLYDDESVQPLNAPIFGDSTYMLFFERVTA